MDLVNRSGKYGKKFDAFTGKLAYRDCVTHLYKGAFGTKNLLLKCAKRINMSISCSSPAYVIVLECQAMQVF